MNRKLRRAAVISLSAGLVLTVLAGCSKNDKMNAETAAITVNGDTISAGVLNLAVRFDQVAVESLYASFGITDPFSQDLTGTGVAYGETVKSQEAENLTHALLAEQHMVEYDVELSDDEKANIAATAAEFIEANDAEVLEKMGTTQEVVERYLELTLVQYKMEEAMPADIDTEVSDEEAAQRRVQYVLFYPVTEEETEEETEAVSEAETTAAETAAAVETEIVDESETSQESASLVQETLVRTTAADETESEITAAEATVEVETEAETEDPETAEAMAKALEQAEAFMERVQAGEDFETVAGELGENVSEITFGADYYVEELVAATDGLADGTLVETPVKTDSGYYVVRVISQLDREATDDEKENIVEERRSDRIEELYAEWEESAEVSQDADVISQLTFDYYLNPYVEPETEAETDFTPAEVAETEA